MGEPLVCAKSAISCGRWLEAGVAAFFEEEDGEEDEDEELVFFAFGVGFFLSGRISS